MKQPVIIPGRMRHLPLDRRGYPVPVIVMHTNSGEPIFAANDEGVRQQCFDEDRCHICGGKLPRGRWLVGGVLSCCAEHGLILDGGMHEECAHYALKVCPYLAAPKFSGLVGRRQVANSDRKDVLIVDTGTDDNSRPELFVALMAVEQQLDRRSPLPGLAEAEMVYGLRPKPGKVRKLELWRHGRQIVDRAELSQYRDEISSACMVAGDKMRADCWRLVTLPNTMARSA